jgi:hypothetical protein
MPASNRGIIMPQAALQGQAQQTRKSPAVVAGLGAAFIASAITLTMMMSNPSPAVPDQAAASAATPQCKLINREYLVATTSGSGTVRLREGNYLSPPITLSTQPQLVTFPLLRPQTQPVSEVITVEGKAADLVLTSRVTGWKRVFESVDGVVAFQANWAPLKGC